MPAKSDVAVARKKIAVPPPAEKAEKHVANGKDALDLNHLLYALQAVRVGDFLGAHGRQPARHRRQDRRHF